MTKKRKKFLLSRSVVIFLFCLISLVFIRFYLSVQDAQGIPGQLNLQSKGNTFRVTATANTTIPNDLDADTNYWFVVIPAGTGVNLRSPAVKCRTTTANKNCNLTWTAPTGATGYDIYFATGADLTVVAEGTSVKYKTVSTVTSFDLTSAIVATPTGTQAVPSGRSTYFVNLVGYGGLNPYTYNGAKFGVAMVPGTPTPAAQLEVVGSIVLSGATPAFTFFNGPPITPTPRSTDLVVKTWIDILPTATSTPTPTPVYAQSTYYAEGYYYGYAEGYYYGYAQGYYQGYYYGYAQGYYY